MNNLHSNNNNRDLIDLTQFKEMPIKRVICKEVIQKIQDNNFQLRFKIIITINNLCLNNLDFCKVWILLAI